MRVSEQTQNQILAVLRQVTEATARKDIDGVMALVDPGFRAFGIGPGEMVIGSEACRKRLEQIFSQAESITPDLADIYIGAEGTVAWVMADMICRVTEDGTPRTLSGKMTAVLRGTGHAWIFVQMHCSRSAV